MRGHRDILDNIYGAEKSKQSGRAVRKRLVALFEPYRTALLIVLLCIAAESTINLVPGYATARIIDIAIPHSDLRELVFAIGLTVLAASINAGLVLLHGYYVSWAGEGMMRDLRTDLADRVHHMPMGFFTNTKSGEISNRVLNDVDNIQTTIAGTFTTIATSIFGIVTTTVAMLLWNWRLAIVSILIVPFMVWPLQPLLRRVYAARKKTREKRGDVQAMVQETISLSGVTLVKLFGREKFERKRVQEAGTRLMDMEVRLALTGQWLGATITSLVVLGPAIIWLCGGWLALHRAVDIGVVVAFIGYVQTRLYQSVASLTGVQAQVASALAVFDRIFEYLDMPIEPYNSGDVVLPNIRGEVSFENVTFCYDERRVVISNATFHIAAGQVAAFVGPSGAGKTTITTLVPRFYDPQGGRILIDGHDIRTLSLEWLRSLIGIVTQETYLFHDTISANLRYAKPEATDENIRAAAEMVNMHAVITGLPDGYETVVGERGHKLSGGERQRLAIARVLLKDPRILILDEATSSLDSQNEAAIQAAFKVAMRGRTCLVIAHRLSTIVDADVIAVLESGSVAEVGRHEALLARKGSYANLYHQQFRSER